MTNKSYGIGNKKQFKKMIDQIIYQKKTLKSFKFILNISWTNLKKNSPRKIKYFLILVKKSIKKVLSEHQSTDQNQNFRTFYLKCKVHKANSTGCFKQSIKFVFSL